MKSHVLIATAGRPELVPRLFDSLAECDRPESLRTILVVENGPQCGVEALCDEYGDRLPTQYLWSAPGSKSIALNVAIDQLGESDLVIMLDDDVRVSPGTLVAYERAASERPTDWFFGGPFHAEYEACPAEWLRPYLPPSARGWFPSGDVVDAEHQHFIGLNWAAYVRDLRAVGMFNPNFGPGTQRTGQETELQRRLHSHGLQSWYVPEAVVWHYVPVNRCSPEWALHRARRAGGERGLRVREKGVADVVANHALNYARLTLGRVGSSGDPGSSPHAFRMAYEQARAQGYFDGFNSANKAA